MESKSYVVQRMDPTDQKSKNYPGSKVHVFLTGTRTYAPGVKNGAGADENPLTADGNAAVTIQAPGPELGVPGVYDIEAVSVDGAVTIFVPGERFADTAELAQQTKTNADIASAGALTASEKATIASNSASVALATTKLYASTAEAQADSGLANGSTYTVGIIGQVNSAFRAYRKDSSFASTPISNPYPSTASLDGPAIQRIGVSDAPIHGQKTGNIRTRFFAVPATQDSVYNTVGIYNELAGATYKFGAGTKVGDTYAPIDGSSWQSVTLADAGLCIVTLPVPVVVLSGQVPGWIDPMAQAYTSGLEGAPVATFGTNTTPTGGTAAASTANRYQMFFNLEYQQRIVTATAVKDLQDGKAGVVETNMSSLNAVTANRARVTDLPTGPTIANKAGKAWRGADGKVLSSALGAQAIANMKYWWAGRDAIASNGLVTRWPDQNGMALVQQGATPPIYRGGITDMTDRLPLLVISGFGASTAKLLDRITLPASAIRPNSGAGFVTNGFTITGLSLINDGSGRFLAVQYGKGGSESTFAPSLIVLAPDRRTILKEMALSPTIATTGGVQGCVWDESRPTTCWLVARDEKKVYQFDFVSGTFTGAVINLSSFTGLPNGLARYPALDALFISEKGSTVCKIYSCTSLAALSQTAVVRDTTDQLFFDSTKGILYGSAGANAADVPGAAGTVEGRDIVYGKTICTYTLPGATAIEGFVIVDDRLYEGNDEGYHRINSLSVSTINVYEIVPAPAALYSDVLTITVAMRQTAVPGSAQAIVAEGDASSNTQGWYLLLTGSNTLRLTIKTQNTGDVRINWTVPGLFGDVFKKIVIRADRNAGTATLLVDGSTINGTITDQAGASTTMSTANVLNPFILTRLAVGGVGTGTARNLTCAEIGDVGVGGDCVAANAAAYLAASTLGLAA